MRSCLKGINDSRCDCRGIEGAISALTCETPFGNNPCPIQRASSRSNATKGPRPDHRETTTVAPLAWA